jgi:hypothetical protein
MSVSMPGCWGRPGGSPAPTGFRGRGAFVGALSLRLSPPKVKRTSDDSPQQRKLTAGPESGILGVRDGPVFSGGSPVLLGCGWLGYRGRRPFLVRVWPTTAPLTTPRASARFGRPIRPAICSPSDMPQGPGEVISPWGTANTNSPPLFASDPRIRCSPRQKPLFSRVHAPPKNPTFPSMRSGPLRFHARESLQSGCGRSPGAAVSV